MTELQNAIEAILFYQAEPISLKKISHLLKKTEGEVRVALGDLEQRLSSTGLRLISLDNSVTLGTAPSASELIEAIKKEELTKELSKASLETLSIVLYKGPVTRADIDYIRGVNSAFILRNLLIRGLVEKTDNPKDQRSFLYKPTFQLLQFMGATNIKELPDYEQTMTALEAFLSSKEEPTVSEQSTSEISTSFDDATDEMEAEMGMNDVSQEFSDTINSEVEADITEEDQAVGNFDDGELNDHLQRDTIDHE